MRSNYVPPVGSLPREDLAGQPNVKFFGWPSIYIKTPTSMPHMADSANKLFDVCVRTANQTFKIRSSTQRRSHISGPKEGHTCPPDGVGRLQRLHTAQNVGTLLL